MGYTIEELEEMLQMAVTKIEWRSGELWYRDGCCDWYKVLGANAPILQQGSVSNAEKTADQLIQAILDGLDVSLPTLPPIPAPTGHITTDSVRCSKATAIQDGLFLTMGDIEEILDLMPVGEVTLTGAISVVGAVIASAGTAAIFLFAATLVSALAGEVVEDIMEEITEDTNNTALRDLFICELIPHLSEGTEITGADVVASLGQWGEIFAPSAPLREIIGAFPAGYLRDSWQALVPQTPCACEDYQPFGYTPPPPPGLSFAFERLAYLGSIGWNSYPGWVNQPYEAAVAPGHTGTVVGGKPRTVYTGVESSNSLSQYAAIYKLSEPASITNIKLSWEFTNGGVAAKWAPFIWSTAIPTWTLFGGFWEDLAAPFDTESIINAAAQTAEYIAIIMRTRWVTNTYLYSYAQNVNLELTGVYGGNGFVDLGIGENFSP